MTEHVKVRFEVEGWEGLPAAEGIWTVPTQKGYQIANIPFYVRGIALDDIISVHEDEDGTLCFQELLEESGHSTVRIFFHNTDEMEPTRALLKSMGCNSEKANEVLITVDVPPEAPYAGVNRILEERVQAGTLEYEEGCLAQR